MLKILIVDDDDIVLLVQRKLLQRCGFRNEIFSFKGGKEALEFLRKESRDHQYLVLLDINMPHLNGWDVLAQLEELNSAENIQVIMVTSSIDMYDKKLAAQLKSVVGFIEKPITEENCKGIKELPALKEFFLD